MTKEEKDKLIKGLIEKHTVEWVDDDGLKAFSINAEAAMEELIDMLSPEQEYKKKQNELIGDLTVKLQFLEDSDLRKRQSISNMNKQANYEDYILLIPSGNRFLKRHKNTNHYLNKPT